MSLAPRTTSLPVDASQIRFGILRGSPPREYFHYIPKTASSQSPVIVLVHGVTRHAAEHIFRFRSLAERAGAILIAPYFSQSAFGSYQQLIDPKRGVRADLALIDILDAVEKSTGVSTQRVHLFGYSGGAQFVHRFVMVHPDRAAMMLIASAGWYTFPDESLSYPYGLAHFPLSGIELEPRRFLMVERHLLVGAQDTSRGDNLRTSHRVDELQGPNRVERAKRWFKAMENASRFYDSHPPKATFEIISGVGHSFSGSARRRSLPERVMRHIVPEVIDCCRNRGLREWTNFD